MPRLKYLNLSSNSIGLLSGELIGEFLNLQRACKLITLHLEYNLLSIIHPLVAKKIAKQLLKKTNIINLYLFDWVSSEKPKDIIHHPAFKKLSSRLFDGSDEKIKKFKGGCAI